MRLLALVGLLAALAPAAGAQRAEPIRGIWIYPLGSTGAIPIVLRTVSAAGLDTVVVPVFYDGRVIHPSRIFPQHDRFLGSDPAAAVVRHAHQRGLKALAALDVLYWQSSDRPSRVVIAHPTWLERTAEGAVIGDVAGAPGAFVSPSEPRVKSLLADLASELAARYDFDGIVLNYVRWSRLDFLGYADADRKLYLQEHAADPLDIDLLGYATPDDMIQSLVRWQEQQVTAIAEAVAQAFRRGQPGAMVLAVVEPGYYANRTTNPVRQDWRSWLRQEWLTAVVPDGLTYPDAATAQARLESASGIASPAAVALLRSAPGLPLRPQMEAVTTLGLRGYIVWAADSLAQRREALSELTR